MELFTAKGKLNFFLQLEVSMCAPRVTRYRSIRYSSSSHTCVYIGASMFFNAAMICAFRLHRYSSLLQWSVPFAQRGHLVSVNCLYHARMVLSVGGSFACFAWNARFTVTTDLLVWCSNTQNDFSPGAAIFSLHTLASPSGIIVNYDEKPFADGGLSCSFCLYRFRKYVSYGFPIMNFCSPGVHCEPPCI
jgi:hypothetical protein